jgi:hypothetical protein
VANREGVKASLRQYGPAAIARVQTVMQAQALETLNVAAAECSFDTGYMLSKLRLVMSENLLGFIIGWLRSDFNGQVNPVNQRVIRFFYPAPVVLGRLGHAGNDNLTAALEATRADTRRLVAAALVGR